MLGETRAEALGCLAVVADPQQSLDGVGVGVGVRGLEVGSPKTGEGLKHARVREASRRCCSSGVDLQLGGAGGQLKSDLAAGQSYGAAMG